MFQFDFLRKLNRINNPHPEPKLVKISKASRTDTHINKTGQTNSSQRKKRKSNTSRAKSRCKSKGCSKNASPKTKRGGNHRLRWFRNPKRFRKCKQVSVKTREISGKNETFTPHKLVFEQEVIEKKVNKVTCNAVTIYSKVNVYFQQLKEDVKNIPGLNDKTVESKTLKDDSQINKTSLYEDLYNSKFFKIKPTSLSVFILESPVTEINGILWRYFKIEMYRLVTFAKYPVKANLSALVLAADGFVYIGTGVDNDDTVVCYFCCKSKDKWQINEKVEDTHKEISPNCCMVTKINCDNVPLISPVPVGSSFTEAINSLDYHNHHHHTNQVNDNTIDTDSAPGAANVQEVKSTELNAKSLHNPNDIEADCAPHQYSEVSNLESSFRGLTQNSTTSASITVQPDPSVSRSSGHLVQNVEPSPTVSLIPSTVDNNSQVIADPTPALKHTLCIVPNNPPPSPSPSSNSTTSNTSATSVTSNTSSQPKGKGRGPTYAELGIITERPKRPEYVKKDERAKTFTAWPRDHHLSVPELVEAGFYYAGYGDCARCFYCGGGLRNWEDEDDVFVEHARWFPKCAFIRQLMGHAFVDMVQELNKTLDKIPYKLVKEKIGAPEKNSQLDTKDEPIKRDPAVRAVMEIGYKESDVVEAAKFVKKRDSMLSADSLVEELKKRNCQQTGQKLVRQTSFSIDNDNEEEIRKMKEKNNELRQQTVCKICMDKDVAVVFLPCGHLASCTDCAASLDKCPICRNPVKGIVRAFIG
ncbi:uncharacterized protein LOC131935472 [Physella acuta]|uniref:uncharacterized protein LOC131935472 n=1 Tax=Physella acuta TaxID=109671 RepID=UPI0027DBA82B|nr:uncharacterized protein LOC131935472 [Physella acuta]